MPPLVQAKELMFSDISSSECASTTAGSPFSDFLPFPDVPLDFQSDRSTITHLPSVLTHPYTRTEPLIPLTAPEPISITNATATATATATAALDALFGTVTQQATEHALPSEELSWPMIKTTCRSTHSVRARVTKPHHTKRERPYVCTALGCKKSFAKKWNLQAHERLHTGHKPFTCRLGCGEKLMWMSSLRSHERRKCRLLPDNLRFRRKPRTRKSNPDSHLSLVSLSTTHQLPAQTSLPVEETRPNIQQNILSELENILASTSESSNFHYLL